VNSWRHLSAWSPAQSKFVTGQAHYLAQCQVLLPVETNMPHLAFARRLLHRHTGACVWRQPRWLLCRSTAGAPKKMTDKLRHVLNTAAWVTSKSGKYELWCHTISALCRQQDPVTLCIWVYKFQHSMAPRYLAELCRPDSNIDGHWHLRSAARHSSRQIVNIQRMHILLPELQFGMLFPTF